MATATKPKPKDYKTDREPIWCPGCGDFGTLNALYQALAELEVESHNLALVSGIGCSSRLPYFVSAYCYHGVHGRALPTAMGVKLANPNLTVIVAGGDGDAFSIGAGHIPHCVRRNPDITYIVMDNEVYGLTKGQVAPNSPAGTVTGTTPHGSLEAPVSPTALMVAYGASFVARGYAGNPKQLRDIYIRAIRHPGFAFIDVLSPCPTYNMNMTYQTLRPQVKDVPENHDVTDRPGAFKLALDPDPLIGIFYQVDSVPYEKRLADQRAKQIEYGGKGEIQALIHSYA
jgi:2-oxoglutarate ferredoxin oxidoreductase subunit beta